VVGGFASAATSKYAFVKVDRDTVDFGDMHVGSVPPATDRVVRLTNVAPVRTSWRLEQLDNDHILQFSARPKEGVLAPGLCVLVASMLLHRLFLLPAVVCRAWCLFASLWMCTCACVHVCLCLCA
jgi:hypothetical protein